MEMRLPTDYFESSIARGQIMKLNLGSKLNFLQRKIHRKGKIIHNFVCRLVSQSFIISQNVCINKFECQEEICDSQRIIYFIKLSRCWMFSPEWLRWRIAESFRMLLQVDFRLINKIIWTYFVWLESFKFVQILCLRLSGGQKEMFV